MLIHFKVLSLEDLFVGQSIEERCVSRMKHDSRNSLPSTQLPRNQSFFIWHPMDWENEMCLFCAHSLSVLNSELQQQSNKVKKKRLRASNTFVPHSQFGVTILGRFQTHMLHFPLQTGVTKTNHIYCICLQILCSSFIWKFIILLWNQFSVKWTAGLNDWCDILHILHTSVKFIFATPRWYWLAVPCLLWLGRIMTLNRYLSGILILLT